MIRSQIMYPSQLAVCCLNVSEGRNHHILESIAKAAVRDQEHWSKDRNILISPNVNHTELKSKATVLSVYMDKFYNRGNITIAAPVNYLSTSIYQASVAAFENINLKDHVSPGHPRLGVVDLIPIHPISSTVSLETCGTIARNVATRIINDVKGTSVFFFGHADTEKRGLVQRRKEINWFEMKSATPDMGEINERYGLTGIGAIPYMSVLNILLDTNDLRIGQKIASNLRAANNVSGLPGIQTMAFKKDEGVEIACNIDTNNLQCGLNVFKTSFEDLENAIRECAAEFNVAVLRNVIRGFSPHEAYHLALRALTIGDISPWQSEDVIMM